nr:flowering time control protein FPA-like [Tanacetum cinerariifolium]
MSSWNLFVAPDITIMHVDYMRSQSREATLPSEEDEQKSSNTLCISYPRIIITSPIANQTEGLSWSPKAFVPSGSFDSSQIQREPKRLRTEGTMPYGEMNDRPNQISRGLVPSNTRFTNTSPNVIVSPDASYIWRGIIAKGGNRICLARCVPVRDWIGYELPDIVNCSARTGLDTLEKHYAYAIGFDIIYFLPDFEDDFDSYTEFLRYMGDRNRAGVAKFDNGTTLFLVPPSDFLTRVLKVAGPPRLYGVVLKFPQHDSELASGPQISQPLYTNPLPMYYAPPAAETSAIPGKCEKGRVAVLSCGRPMRRSPSEC